jgi:cytochrome c oxidase assembly protein subunit 15
VPVPLALAHQAVAIVVLTLAVYQAERLAARPQRAPRNLVQPLAQTG